MKAFILLLSAAAIVSCSTVPEQQTAKKLKIAVIKYQHETCTFCPGGDTEIGDWTKLGPPLGGEALLSSGNYIRGFVNRARSYPDVDLIGITSPNDVFGGSSRSWNSKESFEHFMGNIIEELKANMPVEGVYLALHGAMAVRDIPKPEAEIAKRVREVVGPDVPIAGTFDLHGNEDGDFLKYANGAFVTKRYPHYDSYLQGERAAYFIREVILGRYTSTTASRKPPVITGTVLQWTGQSPSMDIMERARRWEARLPDVFVSVFYGFPWSDVPDVGAAVHVMTNGDQNLADSIANDMEEFIWRVREDFALGKYPMPKEAVAQAKSALAAGRTPVVLGDYSDRPGDATWILDELIKQDVSGVLYGALTDANVLEQLEVSEAQPGDDFDMMVGGYTGDQAGEKVRIQGKLKYFGPFRGYEKTAIVEFGEGNALFITPTYEQLLYPEQMRVGGINPDDYQVFVVKSRVHFRRGFDETGYAKEVIVVDAPGDWFGTIRLDALDYQYAPIDKLYPFDGSVQ
ncbi:MAG: M81 family metallopeptidase [Cyclobacteriaceae bacterium]